MAVIVLPISAVMVALALPGMRVVAFGNADGTGVGLLAAALASLAVGLFPYGAFQSLARADYDASATAAGPRSWRSCPASSVSWSWSGPRG